MNCIICDTSMFYYFSKRFEEYGLSEVDYWVCPACGFTGSKTHSEMTDDAWTELNSAFHADSNARTDNPYDRNQRYFHQALLLYLMVRNDLVVDDGQWLDWGSGVGSLSVQLREHFDLRLMNFDRYVQPKIYAIQEADLRPGAYSVVVNTGVFEHVRRRATLDEIASFVSPTGCLAVHTQFRGEIPNDPDWSYLLPVHCAFHTNKSMQILMDAWGFTCSLYNEPAKTWVLFRHSPAEIQRRVEKLSDSMGWEYLHYKEGFMDYWP